MVTLYVSDCLHGFAGRLRQVMLHDSLSSITMVQVSAANFKHNNNAEAQSGIKSRVQEIPFRQKEIFLAVHIGQPQNEKKR